jgi:hypothetical protein
MTDQTYLIIQFWMITLLLFVDGATALIQHPNWFQ